MRGLPLRKNIVIAGLTRNPIIEPITSAEASPHPTSIDIEILSIKQLAIKIYIL